MDQHLFGIAGLLTGLMLFAYWLHYCMGSPMAMDVEDVDVGAILFSIPAWLADRRLVHQLTLTDILEAQREELNVTSDPVKLADLMVDHARDRYEAGRKFFTWEKSFLCPICLHWWLTVIVVGLALVFNWLQIRDHAGAAALIYLINHLFIRKIA
jgi:hypothetical protein